MLILCRRAISARHWPEPLPPALNPIRADHCRNSADADSSSNSEEEKQQQPWFLCCRRSNSTPFTMLQRLLRPQSGLRAASAISQVSRPNAMQINFTPSRANCLLTSASKQKPSSVLPRYQYRSLHRVPQLTHEAIFREHGISELMSPGQFDFAWTQYQELMVEKLNLMTQGERGIYI